MSELIKTKKLFAKMQELYLANGENDFIVAHLTVLAVADDLIKIFDRENGSNLEDELRCIIEPIRMLCASKVGPTD